MLFLLFYHCLVEPPCGREQDQPVHCGQDHRVQLSPERQQGDYDDYDDDDDDDNEDQLDLGAAPGLQCGFFSLRHLV